MQTWKLRGRGAKPAAQAPHELREQVRAEAGSQAPAPAQAVTLSIWWAETSLCPFNVTQRLGGQLLRGDACLICLAGTASPLLLHFSPRGSESLRYWLIFHFASVVTRPGNEQWWGATL